MRSHSLASKFPFLEHPGPIAFAHRGGSLEAPENTLVAFENARRLGYRYIETDAVATRDGILLAFHDGELDRLTDSRGRVREMSFEQVRTARVAGREPIPRLDELLGDWPQMRLNIEPKDDAAIEPLVQAIQRTNAVERVCIGSFVNARTRRLRQLLGPRLCTSPGPLGVARLRLASFGPALGNAPAPCLQVPVSHRGIRIIDARFLRAAHMRDAKVHVWTVDDEAQMHRLLDLGVDGLMSDRPTLLKAVLESRGQWFGG
jgi:glycerophosphoryl diester phosphodiesterase